MRCVHWSPLFVILAASLFATGQSPVAGPNVNMVSGTQWPGGDPYLQRQNEPSLAVSTRNPQHLLSGANDYRTVDIPFPQDSGSETGDAWLGVFKSTDGGQTWFSTLVPGYPQDTSAVGSASPLKAYSVATDPTVRSGTHGMFYYSGLAFTRGSSGTSAVFVSRFRDDNNKGNGDPFSYLSASIIDTGTSGQFLDKPWLVVDVPRTNSVGSATCTINGKTFTSGNVYLVYSVFLGSNPSNNPHSQINFVKSTNCGATWSKPTKLSESFTLNQGTVAAIDPGTGALYIAWRQISTVNQPDSILYAVSTNGGQTFTKAAIAFQFPANAAFDQSSSSSAFRTIALPALSVDGNGRVFLAWSQRNIGPYNSARIMMSTLPRGGTAWSTPFLVDPTATGPGHQFLPSLSFAYGKLMMAFYDLREDQTSGVLQCPAGQTCSNTGDFLEARVPQGDLADGNAVKVYTPVVSDAGLKRRHTIDVRGAEADPSTFNSALNPPLNFSGFRISQYKYGSRPGSTKIEQMQFNPPNFPLFVKGTRAFMGDYIEIAALPFLVDASGKWTFNSQKSNAPVFHATWTDNRDVRPPPVTCDPITGVCTQNWSLYTPVASAGGPSIYDSAQSKPACVPTQTGSRNENIYTSRISEGLIVGIRENTKPLNSSISLQRAFAVTVQNNTNKIAYYRLSFAQPLPANTTASFSQTQSSPTLDVSVGPRSSIARLAFLSSTSPTAQVGVVVSQISAVGGTVLIAGLNSTAIVNPDITNPDITNPDITNPDITNPDITNPDITNPDIHNAEIYNPTVTNPNITNPDITNPDITNPDITNPDITNPDITNPDITNPDINSLVVTNPDITNPDITNPDITNPDITNPDITNPDITSLSTGATDFTWKLTNRGNTTSSYNAKLQSSAPVCCPAGCPGGNSCPASCNKCQLILRRTYTTPIANACQLTVETQNVPVTSVPNPAFADGATVENPDLGPQITNATISLGPGQAGRITLRVFGLTTSQIPPGFLKASGISQSANTGNVPAAASLTITTLALPAGFVGQPYSASLQSIGGVGPARTWSIFSGSLPSGLTLNAVTGQITGVITGASGTTSFVAQVIDSPTAPTLPHVDRQTVTLNVNDLRIVNVLAAKVDAPGQTMVKGGDMITVAVDVRSTGSTPASTVTPLALTVNSAGANAACAAALPVSASIGGDTTQTFTYACGPVSGDGSLTVTAQATGVYNSGAGTVTLTTPAVTSNSVTIDSTSPSISVTANTPDGPYTAGNWTNREVALSFQCADANGIASGYPTGNVIVANETGSAGQAVTGTCKDTVGNVATLNFGPIKIDKTAPVISTTRTPAANPAGWNNSPVTVNFVCSDSLSGVASTSPSTTLSGDGTAQFVMGSCTDNAGNVASANASGINIDQTPPVVFMRSPVNGVVYLVSAPVGVSYTCSDGISGVASCSGPVASGTTITVPAGANAVTVTSTDVAGNTTSVTVNFQGTGYSLTGFLSPLVVAGSYSAPSQAGSFNFGKAIPIKWQLRGAIGSVVENSIATLKLMRAISNSACTGAPAEGAQTLVLYNPTNGATGGSTFRYDSSTDQYIFNWDTSSASRGCFNLVVDLADGSTYATIVKLQ